MTISKTKTLEKKRNKEKKKILLRNAVNEAFLKIMDLYTKVRGFHKLYSLLQCVDIGLITHRTLPL